jgi:hypothetical protein
MRLTWAAAAAALTICAAASAAERSTNPVLGGPSVGIGIICNTAEQAARFVSLRAGGADSPHAIQAVNIEAKDAHACDKLLQVVRVNILAGFNGNAWQQTAGMIQYAVIEGEGEAI